MVEIKGSTIADSIKAIKERSGEETYRKILQLLPDDLKKIFDERKILFTNWYPLDQFVRFLEADIIVTANSNPEILLERSKKVIRKQLTGIYKIIVKLGSPQFVLKGIATTHRLYFRGVQIETKSVDHRKFVIRYNGFKKEHQLIRYCIIGFYQEALKISGAKKVETTIITDIKENKGYLEFELTWS